MFENIMELKDISGKGTDSAKVKVKFTFETEVEVETAHFMIAEALPYLKRNVLFSAKDPQEPLPMGDLTPKKNPESKIRTNKKMSTKLLDAAPLMIGDGKPI